MRFDGKIAIVTGGGSGIGSFLCAKHAVPAMRASGGGAIVNTASILGHVGFTDATSYAAAKAGVVNMTRVLALSYAKDKIRANSVAPGFIRTPMVTEGPVSGQLDALASLHPLGRLGEPEEVAQAIAFLASDAASFVTGISLLVDGGYTAQLTGPAIHTSRGICHGSLYLGS